MKPQDICQYLIFLYIRYLRNVFSRSRRFFTMQYSLRLIDKDASDICL